MGGLAPDLGTASLERFIAEVLRAGAPGLWIDPVAKVRAS
jgi:hypothetical protein